MKKKIIFAFIISVVMILLYGIKSDAITNEEDNIIENGIYSIQMSSNNQRIVQVLGDQKSNESPISVWNYNKNITQKFQITYLNDGYYQIKHCYSGKVLDVYSSAKYNGAKVQIYDWSNTDNQKWKIRKNMDGTYSIISKCNGLYLDVYGGFTQNGTIIQMYTDNGGASGQKFIFNKLQETKGTRTIEDGIYSIKMSKNQQRIIQVLGDQLANESSIGIWNYNKNITQKFQITYLDDGYYQIKHIYSGRVLDVYSSAKYNGAKVQLYDWYNTDNQKWIIRKNEDNTYSFISKCNDLTLDVYGGNTENGTLLQMYSDIGSTAQKFIMDKQENLTPTKSIEDGIYYIRTSYNGSKVLEVQNSSYYDMANVQIGTKKRTQNQKFRIEEIDKSGYYKITSINSGKALDVYTGGKGNCTNVEQYTPINADSQKWIIKKNTDNTYTLYAKCNDLALDVYGAGSADGTNVEMYMPHGGNSQKFVFEEANIIENGEYELESKLIENQLIDIAGGSSKNYTQALLWDANNTAHQKFLFIFENEGYKIQVKQTGKLLSIGEDGSVYQYDESKEQQQEWKIKEAGSGCYYIYSENSGLYLTAQNNSAQNGSRIIGTTKNENDAQKFKITNEVRRFYQEGTYGRSGLAVIGDYRGTNLKYYKFGKGENVLFATYSIHGFEDDYNQDGKELTYIAECFKTYLQESTESNIFYNWQIYLFPTLNPDGQNYGWTNNGPGRTTLISSAPNRQGIDMNRNWQINGQEYVKYKEARNYNGTEGFQAYEARALRDFLLEKKATNGQTILIDLHGWLNETIGDNGLGSYYRNQYNMQNHISTYGRGYLINWARNSLGGTRTARSALVELPPVYSHQELLSRQFEHKYIEATMNVLRENGTSINTYSTRNKIRSTRKKYVNSQMQYKTALAGALKNAKPEENEIDNLILDFSIEKGMYITENSREKFQQILKECNVKAFTVDNRGFLVKTNFEKENNIEEKLDELISNGKKYIIDITDICYIRDEINGEITEYPFVELDSTQICEPFENDDTELLFINNKEDKITAMEILETILKY